MSVMSAFRNFLPAVLRFESEYSPAASQCHTSTIAPASATQPALPMDETRRLRFRSAPSLTDLSAGSERMSERLRRTSVKNGPSVCSGVTMQDGSD
ncbi:hypothetical protein D3C83_09510 [compost metagenome]